MKSLSLTLAAALAAFAAPAFAAQLPAPQEFQELAPGEYGPPAPCPPGGCAKTAAKSANESSCPVGDPMALFDVTTIMGRQPSLEKTHAPTAHKDPAPASETTRTAVATPSVKAVPKSASATPSYASPVDLAAGTLALSGVTNNDGANGGDQGGRGQTDGQVFATARAPEVNVVRNPSDLSGVHAEFTVNENTLRTARREFGAVDRSWKTADAGPDNLQPRTGVIVSQ